MNPIIDWVASIDKQQRPAYLAIAMAVERAIAQGMLRSGDQMPTHRELAGRLGVTVGTVTRAYGVALKRGFLMADRRRGTIVQHRGQTDATKGRSADRLDLTLNRSLVDGYVAAMSNAFRALADSPAVLKNMQDYGPTPGIAAHRQAAASWINRSGLAVTPDHIIVCNGAQHGLSVAVLAVVRPGDPVYVEALTYPGVKVLASLLGLRLIGLPIDDEGIDPASLETACRTDPARLLICVPTLHNPTNAMMSAERRAEIASIARRYSLTIIEDDTYGPLLDDWPKPLATFLPESSILITSLSKAVAPALRLGFVAAPRHLLERIAAGVRGTIWMTPPLIAEIASRWIEDGTIDRLIDQQRRHLAERHRIATAILGNLPHRTHPRSPHVWLNLPTPWRGEEFREAAWSRGIEIMAADAFAVAQTPAPHAVRLSLGGAPDVARLKSALTVLVEMLEAGPLPASFVM